MASGYFKVIHDIWSRNTKTVHKMLSLIVVLEQVALFAFILSKKKSKDVTLDFFRTLLLKCFLIAGVSAPSLPMAVGNGTTPTRNTKKDKSGKKGKGKLTKQDIGTPTDFR